MPDVPVLGQSAAREREIEAAIAAEVDASLENSPPLIEATTAFIVAWVNGQVLVFPDLDTAVVKHHDPTADEIHGAAANLMKDRTTEEIAQIVIPNTAQATVQLLMQAQKNALEAMRAQQGTAEVKAALAAEQQRRPRG